MRISKDTKDIIGLSLYVVGIYMAAFTLYWLLLGTRGYIDEFMSWGGATRHGLGMFHQAMALIVIYAAGAICKSLYKDWKCSR